MKKYEIVPMDPAVLALIEKQKAGTLEQPLSREILLLDVKLANTCPVEVFEPIAHELAAGAELQMMRTPSGDEFAISVNYGECRVGAIPMAQNVVLARLMDAGKMLSCRVESAGVEKDFKSPRTWVRIFVKIYLID